MTAFKNHFSNSSGYAIHRPSYPPELFSFLAGIAPARAVAWDCATGSGQAARGLRERFSLVAATDASVSQLLRAGGERDFYLIGATAESAPLRSRSVDLVTVGQALHWFDVERFYAEVRRVAKPDAVLAAWTYPLLSAGRDVDPLIAEFSERTVGPYWPPERRQVDSSYRHLPFPFQRLETPTFAMEAIWELDDLTGYLDTWSAVNRYRKEVGEDPLEALVYRLEPLWKEERVVIWDLPLLVGVVG